MKLRPLLGLLAIATLVAVPARAQLEGDILVNMFDPASLGIFAPDGTAKLATTRGTGSFWLGASRTGDDLLVTTRRLPNGVNLFDRTGREVATFDTPQVTFATGDVSVFADGTLAVTDQDGQIELYTRTGVHVGAFPVAGPFGNYVDANDDLWVAGSFRIVRFDRSGTQLGTISTNFAVGDVVAPGDGTVWATDRNSARVVQFDRSGAELRNFATGLPPFLYGIALARDGTVLVTSWQVPAVHRFGRDGTPLGKIDLPSSPLFLSVIDPLTSPAVVFCTAKANSLGCLPAIAPTGTPRASGRSGFVVSATNVRNASAGLLLYSVSGRIAAPFQGGTLCLAAPVLRTPPRGSGGSPPPAASCDGAWRLDMNAFGAGLAGGAPHPSLRLPGTFVHCQWWGRDRADAFGSALTDALQYEIAP